MSERVLASISESSFSIIVFAFSFGYQILQTAMELHITTFIIIIIIIMYLIKSTMILELGIFKMYVRSCKLTLKIRSYLTRIYKLPAIEIRISIKKLFPVTGREGPWGCETSRLPHFIDNRLTDGVEDVSLKRRPAVLYPRKIPGTHFLLEFESTPGP
jgi:hypothetical protein